MERQIRKSGSSVARGQRMDLRGGEVPWSRPKDSAKPKSLTTERGMTRCLWRKPRKNIW
jgi:hypothetical protein